MSYIVWLAQCFYNFAGLARLSKTPQFVTIAYSHYNEFARWCLEFTGSSFVEHGYAPGQHILPALSVRVARDGTKHMPTSSSMTPGKSSPTSTPILVYPDGSVCRDSWEIAERTGLAACDAPLKEVLDRELGPLARQNIYSYLLKPQHAARFDAIVTEGRHCGWRLLWCCGIRGFLRGRLSKSMKTEDAAAKAECSAALEALVRGKLAAALAARKGPYLGGDKPSTADFALASFMALLVLPENYGGRTGTMGPHLLAVQREDAEVRASVEKWRATEVGAYAMQLYAKLRLK